jgi:serine/threonine protein kinase
MLAWLGQPIDQKRHNPTIRALRSMGCSVSHCQQRDTTYELPQLNNDMFVIQGLIGEGGFGKVLSATVMQTGKWVAVKEINKVRQHTIRINRNQSQPQ